MSKESDYSDLPVIHLNFHEIKDREILDTIVVEGSKDPQDVKIRILRSGYIQLTSNKKKSNHFKGSDEKWTLNLSPPMLKAILDFIKNVPDDK